MGEEVAVERLAAARVEQARLEAAHRRALGTEGEMVSTVRLQASNLRVAVCDRMVSALALSRRRWPER